MVVVGVAEGAAEAIATEASLPRRRGAHQIMAGTAAVEGGRDVRDGVTRISGVLLQLSWRVVGSMCFRCVAVACQYSTDIGISV